MKPLAATKMQSMPAMPDTITTILLTTSAQAFDTPAGAKSVVFGCSGNFVAALGSTGAAWPAASSTDASTQGEVNPGARFIGSTTDCTGFSILGSSAGLVATASWFGV